MGLFSKKKEELDNNILGDIPMPVKNEVKSNNIDLQMPTSSSVNLSAPPIPGGNLTDIKNEVSAPSFSSGNSFNESYNSNSFDVEDGDNVQIKEQEMVMPQVEDDSDSLFDFSELDNELDFSNKVNENVKRQEVVSELPEINFVEDEKHHSLKDETYFVTTSQFKSLLEIVDSVKTRVKEASETHLKLMDLKSEEDIEYENLRKDFQFIEEKLYEVDSLIFDK